METFINLVVLALHICVIVFASNAIELRGRELKKLTVAFQARYRSEDSQIHNVYYDTFYHERLGHLHLVGNNDTHNQHHNGKHHHPESTAAVDKSPT